VNTKILLALLIITPGLLFLRAGEPETLAATPPANIRVAQVSGPQNEPSIAVNPLNQSNLIASSRDFSLGYRQCRYYYSFDGGETWGNHLVPMTGSLSPFVWCSDASVGFDGLGNAYYTALAFTPGSMSTYRGAVFVARSTDGGRSYGNLVLVRNVTGVKDDVGLDKPYIAVDQKYNHVYVTWTELPFTNSSAWIDFSRSLNNAASFSPLIRVTDLVNNATWSSLGQASVGPKGEIYVEWVRGFNPDNNTYSLVFDRSLDFGVSFGVDKNLTSFPAIPGSLNPYTFRATSIPSIDADRSNGSSSGAVYITWADERNGDADVFEIHSYNRGDTWSGPVRVNDDPIHNRKDQWMPWVNVSPDGGVNVAFFDRRDDSANVLYNLYWARSTDGGVTFQPNVKITTVQSNPNVWAQPVNADSVGPLGDYIGMTSQQKGNSMYIYPIWTDSRDGTITDHNLNIYTAVIGPPTPPINLQASGGTVNIRVTWSLPTSSNGPPVTEYKIYRGTSRGAETYLATLGNITSYDDRTPSLGTQYFYKVSAINNLGEGTFSNEATASAPGGVPTFPLGLALVLGLLVALSLVLKRRTNRYLHGSQFGSSSS
jgi:BNR/Asp-box repeat protein